MAAGRKTGGRQKGSLNKKTAEQLQAVRATGLTPLEYLKSIYQDAGADEVRRIDAAKAAAPYVHARLNAVEHSGHVTTRHAYDFSGIDSAVLSELESAFSVARSAGGDQTGAIAPPPGLVH